MAPSRPDVALIATAIALKKKENLYYLHNVILTKNSRGINSHIYHLKHVFGH